MKRKEREETGSSARIIGVRTAAQSTRKGSAESNSPTHLDFSRVMPFAKLVHLLFTPVIDCLKLRAHASTRQSSRMPHLRRFAINRRGTSTPLRRLPDCFRLSARSPGIHPGLGLRRRPPVREHRTERQVVDSDGRAVYGKGPAGIRFARRIFRRRANRLGRQFGAVDLDGAQRLRL